MLKKISIISIIIIALGFIIWGLFFVKFAAENNNTTTEQIPEDFEYVIVIQHYNNFKMGMHRWGIENRIEEQPEVKKILPWFNLLDSICSHDDVPFNLEDIKIVKHNNAFTFLTKPSLASYTQLQLEKYLLETIKIKGNDHQLHLFNQTFTYGIDKGVVYISTADNYEALSKLKSDVAQNLSQKITTESNENAGFNLITKKHPLTTKMLASDKIELFDFYFKPNGVHYSGWIEKDTKGFSKAQHTAFQFAPNTINALQSLSLSSYKIRTTFKGASLEYYNWIGPEVSAISFDQDTVIYVNIKEGTDAALSLEEVNLKSSTISNPDSLQKMEYTTFTFHKNYAAEKYKQALSRFFSASSISPNWYFSTDDYVIFASQTKTLKKYMDLISKGDIISEQAGFSKTHQKYNVASSSITTYENQIQSEEKDPVLSILTKGKRFSTYSKIDPETVVANIFMQHEEMEGTLPTRSTKDTLWKLKIPELSRIVKSQWFYNHREKLYTILLVDSQNQLYAVDEKGTLKWKKKIDQAINSDFTLVDLYRNNKQQLLFTTKNQIHVLDILGRNVNSFPYSTSSPITSPVSVLDYKNDGNFRIFVGLQNGHVVNVNKEGKAVEGWTFERGKAGIISPLIQTQFNNYDYLHFVDAKGNLYASGRRGEDRLQANISFPKFQNQGLEFHKSTSWKSSHYSYLNRNGWLYNTYINGTYDSLKFEKEGPIKVWEYNFMNADENYWLTTTKGHITVFNKLGIKSFEFATNVGSIQFMEPVNKNGNIYIAFLDGNEKKVYLLDKHGEIVEGYPKKGNQFLSVLDQSSTKNVIFLTIQNDELICLPL